MTTTKSLKVKQSSFGEGSSSSKKPTSSARPDSTSKGRGRAHTVTQREKDERYLKEKAEGNGKRYFQTTANEDANFVVNDIPPPKPRKRRESTARRDAKRGMSEEEQRKFDKTTKMMVKRLFQ